MLTLTHLDGSDVVVIDNHGQHVPAVEVRVEPGFAVVAIDIAAWAWLQALRTRAPDETLEGSVHSASDGHLHHSGALRVVCA
jgi:hypothetical protein